MWALLVPTAAWLSGSGEVPESTPPLALPPLEAPPREATEIRWNPDRPAFPVNSGVQVAARLRGTMPIPPTDPGRTVIHVELLLPLLARNSRTILLPIGTVLEGRVHLLRGGYRFLDFQSFLLPDGRRFVLPDDVFRLGPGRLLATQDGTQAMVIISRPLRMEALVPSN